MNQSWNQSTGWHLRIIHETEITHIMGSTFSMVITCIPQYYSLPIYTYTLRRLNDNPNSPLPLTTPPPFGKPVIHLNNLLFILNKFRFYIFLFRISGSVIQSNPSTVCEINTFLKSFFHKLDCLFSPKYRRLITFLTLITLITFVICCLSQELMFPPCCRVSVS